MPRFYNDEFGPKQEAVLARAEEILKDKPWFRGICLDNFPDERDIENIEDAAFSVALETAMWDDHDFYSNMVQV
jgi:hypothetical protein